MIGEFLTGAAQGRRLDWEMSFTANTLTALAVPRRNLLRLGK